MEHRHFYPVIPYLYFVFTQIQDLIAIPMWVGILLLLSAWLRQKFSVFQGGGKDYFIVLILKMACGILLGLVYQFYYGYGDTLRYFFSGSVIRDYFLQDPSAGWFFLFGNPDHVPPDLKEAALLIPYWKHQASALLVARISAVLSFLTLNSYYANSLIFSFFSFTGIWALYRTLQRYLPGQNPALRLSLLYLPSVLFWGSGLFKDPLTLGFSGWWIWSLNNVILSGGKKLKPWMIVLLASAGLFYLKVYILLVWIPFGIIWLVLERATLLTEKSKRRRFLLISLSIGLLLSGILVSFLTVFYPQFAWDLLMESIVANRNELLYTDKYYGGSGGSRFDIGEFDPTIWGIVKKVPAALFAALFRPSLLDIKSPIMLPAALENTVILFFALRWILRTSLRNLFSGLSARPALTAFFLFALFFSCFVGLSTSNFGTLLRYRLPSLPFFLAGLIALNSYGIKRKDQTSRPDIEEYH
jgi:hypothetical protein